MPAVSIGEGTAVGALSFVAKSLDQWSIYFGSPARKVGQRADRAATLEREALALGIISLP
jgi:galactoside O-acetyltransferase